MQINFSFFLSLSLFCSLRCKNIIFIYVSNHLISIFLSFFSSFNCKRVKVYRVSALLSLSYDGMTLILAKVNLGYNDIDLICVPLIFP